MKKDRLITILGPTASGKTALSIHLAKALDSSIISGDAFQIYKKMDIGTAKVTADEAQGIKHYLVDELDPEESYSAADFQEKAKEIIHRENQLGKIPILCGGTGLYIQGLLEGYSFLPKVKGRSHWEKVLEEKGKEGLIQALKSYGETELPPDPQRMMRKLELLEAGEGQITPDRSDSILYDGPVLGITMDRAVLYDRINKRVHLMIENGLVQEVRDLLSQGLSENAQSLKGIGYKELIPVIKGQRTLEEGEELIQKNTRHFAKRQLTWYRRMPYIHWMNRDSMTEDEWFRTVTSYVISYFRGE